MNILCLVLACMVSMNSWRFYGGPTGYHAIEHHGITTTDPNGFQQYNDVEIDIMNDYNAFKWILANWGRNSVDFRVYSIWAKYYHGGLPKPPVIVVEPDPNDVIVSDPNIIEPRLTGYILPGSNTLHLYRDCRYIYWKEVLNVNVINELISGMSICESCTKREE